MTDDKVIAQLARETPFTRDEWRHAVDTLGAHADALLPAVKSYAAQQGVTPRTAAETILGGTGLAEIPLRRP